MLLSFPICFSWWSFSAETYNSRIVTCSAASDYFTVLWGINVATWNRQIREQPHKTEDNTVCLLLLSSVEFCWGYQNFLREFQTFFEFQLQCHILPWAFSGFSQTRLDFAFLWIFMSLYVQFSHGTKLNLILYIFFRSWDSDVHFCLLSIQCWSWFHTQ